MSRAKQEWIACIALIAVIYAVAWAELSKALPA
jgi:hypothetical protein